MSISHKTSVAAFRAAPIVKGSGGALGEKGEIAEGYPFPRTDIPGPTEKIRRTVASGFSHAESCLT